MKTGKFLLGDSQEQKACTFWVQKQKMLFLMEHPPTCKPNLTYMSSGSAEVPNLQTELNYLDSVMFYCIFSDMRPPALVGGWGLLWVCLGVPLTGPTCTYTYACICMCVTLKYTCIQIANGHCHGAIHDYHV